MRRPIRGLGKASREGDDARDEAGGLMDMLSWVGASQKTDAALTLAWMIGHPQAPASSMEREAWRWVESCKRARAARAAAAGVALAAGVAFAELAAKAAGRSGGPLLGKASKEPCWGGFAAGREKAQIEAEIGLGSKPSARVKRL